MTTRPAVNHYAHENLEAEFAQFRQDYPEYDTTRRLDDLRAEEYARLDQQGHVYLDYTGGGLYGETQLREHMALLTHDVFGNPHSKNPTSKAMTDLVEQARGYVLEYFNASPDEYCVIFTPNASGALKLVGEAYPFEPGGHVKKGQVLFRIDPRPFEVALKSAQALRDQAKATLDFAQAEVNRTEQLADKGFATEQRAQQNQSNLATANAKLEEAEAAIARQRTSAEGQEGLRAFLEKRKPGWGA